MNSPSSPALFGVWSDPERLPQRITLRLRQWPPSLVMFMLSFMAVFVGWVDHQTGWELSFFIFYSIPVLLSVWWVGASAGVFMAIVCGIVWWVSNQWTSPYHTVWGYAWATLSRVFYFGIVVYAVTAVRMRQEADAARIQALEERRQLEKDIVTVSEHEQQRIGQDLHDGLCQQLAAIGCAARVLAEDLKAGGYAQAEDAAAIEESLRQAVMEARDMARGIFPVQVDRIGLSAALRDLSVTTSRLTGINIEVDDPGEVHLDSPETAMHLYRIAQEAVANAVRHAQATFVRIKIHLDEQFLSLIIEDDGCGLGGRGARASEGMGLRTMRYRAQVIGASLFMEPRLGGGTRIRCMMPLSTPTNHA